MEVIGGTTYASGDCWLNCLYEDGTTCPIHISDLIEERPNEALIELDRVKKRAKVTISMITDLNWVVMDDLQTPKLVKRVNRAKLPCPGDKWWLFVGDKTLEEASAIINEQWGLTDKGFVNGDCGIEWNWWEADGKRSENRHSRIERE